MKRVLVAGMCLASLFVAQSALADLRVMAGGGYLSLTNKEKDDSGEKPNFSGFGGSGRVQYDVFSPVPGLSLFAGGGLGMIMPVYTYKVPEVDKELKYAYVETYLPVEFGVQFSAIPMLRLQASGQYHHGLNGKITISGSTGNATYDDLIKKNEPKMESSSRIMLTGRALLTVAPFVSAGLYADYLVSGKIKFEDMDKADWGTGYEAGATVALSF